jgi:hypothetical protein
VVTSVVPHVAAAMDPDADPEPHPKPWGKAPADLPMMALTVRGACTFTDKVRARTPQHMFCLAVERRRSTAS